jgi:Leucine-rich repeat (LRR) protein
MEEKGYYLVNEEAIDEMLLYGDMDDEFEDDDLEFIPIEDVRNHNYRDGGSLLLYVEDLGLTNLDEYLVDGKLPDSLIIINCSNNNLTELPPLPTDLMSLNCSYNKLTELPESIEDCAYLQSLSCNNNELTKLRIPMVFIEDFESWINHGDEEDNSLTYLNCSYNNLTKLPNDLPIGDFDDGELLNKLPNRLESLVCNNNKLTALPELLPEKLSFLNCSDNELTALPILVNNPLKPNAIMNSLFVFRCNNNRITQLPELPNFIKFLNCSNNELTNLPKLPDDLITFYCQGNEYDDEAMLIIIDFCTKAIKNPRKYNQKNPTIKELFKYYTSNREYRAKVFREPFTETSGEFSRFTRESNGIPGRTGPGKTIQKSDEGPFVPKSIPEGSIINILEYANLPTPPASRKNVGGKKNRKAKTKKNKKRITKRKILIKNKSKRNKKN